MRRPITLATVAFVLAVSPLTPSSGAAPRGPERLKDQGLQTPDELEAATRAVRALLSNPDVDDDGLRDIEMVVTAAGKSYWVIGDRDLSSPCRPTLFDESTFGGCDAVRFQRFAATGAAEIYSPTIVAGINPLGDQSPATRALLSTIPKEFAAADRTVGSGGALGCTLASDPDCRSLDLQGVTYPFAYERLSALFDTPRAPDLVVLGTPGGPDGPKGGHGHLSVVQSRSTFLISGRGARRAPMTPSDELALELKHTDIAATIARAIGLKSFGPGAVRLNGVSDPTALLERQDGRVLNDLLEPEFNTFVIVLDGLEPELISPVITPNIWALTHGGASATTYTRATASMTSETNANHVGMMTGLPGALHGIVANNFFNRATNARQPMERPSLILADTLFDAIERQKPWLRTAAVMGKEKLRLLFDCTAASSGDCEPSAANPEGALVSHVRPDFLIGASTNPQGIITDPHHHAPAEPASGSGITLDHAIMDQLIELHRTEDPDFTLVNLGQIDALQHAGGAKGPLGLTAVTNADVQIGRLIESLKTAGKWQHSIVILTADHSFSDLDGVGDAAGNDDVRASNPIAGHATGSRVVLTESFTDPGIAEMVAHGGSASIYLDDPSDAALASSLAARARQMTDALGRKSVAAAYCRLASDGCPKIPAAWGLDTARIGEVLLTADDEHVFLRTRAEASGALSGHHGGPTSLPVPLIVASGGSYVRSRVVGGPVTSRDIAPTVGWIYGITGPDGLPFPGANPWSKRLAGAFSKNPFQAQAQGDLTEPLAKRVLLVTFDANNSNDVHCLLAQYDGPAAVDEFCGPTSTAFNPALYPVPTIKWLRDRGTLTRYGSIASFPTVTFPNHNVVGSGVHPAHHDVPGNRFYEREQQRMERPIDPTNTQNPVYFWSESLYGPGFETLHEATHRSFGDWMGPSNADATQAGGAYTASVNEPTVRGADFASIEPLERTTGEPAFAVNWARADELAADTTQSCAQREEGYFEESALDHIGQGQARSLFQDPGHPPPAFTMLNFTLTDGAAHTFGPHTACAFSSYRDSAQRLGRVLEGMREAGTLGETLIVLTGDHGQENQRPLAGGGGLNVAINQGLAGSGVNFELADSFMYLRTMKVTASPGSLAPGTTQDLRFTVRDQDTGETVPTARVTVRDAGSGTVLAEGETPPDQSPPRRKTVEIPRRISDYGNAVQKAVTGEQPAGDLPTVTNPLYVPSSGKVALRIAVPAGGIDVSVTKQGFSDRTFALTSLHTLTAPGSRGAADSGTAFDRVEIGRRSGSSAFPPAAIALLAVIFGARRSIAGARRKLGRPPPPGMAP